METDWECVVIGGGVAGLSAALVLGRARRRTLVLDRGGQSNRAAAHIGGLLGQDGTAPGDFYAGAREQLSLYDTVVIRDVEAVDARAEGDGFILALAGDGGEARTRAVVLATGMDYEVPDVPVFREHWGGAVFHCPFCHGWEVRDRTLVVYGEGEVADRQAALLRGCASSSSVACRRRRSRPACPAASPFGRSGGGRSTVKRDTAADVAGERREDQGVHRRVQRA